MLRRAKAIQGLGEKVVVVQMEYSPFTLDVEKNGGIADVCEELGFPWWRTVCLGGDGQREVAWDVLIDFVF